MTLATYESLSNDAKKHPLVETHFHPFELAIGTAIELSALEQAKYKYDDPAGETFVTDQLAGINDNSKQEEITDYISTVRFFYTLRRSVLKDQYTTKTPTTMQKAINGFMKQMAHESAT